MLSEGTIVFIIVEITLPQGTQFMAIEHKIQ